jgi:hypothetical protein
MERSIASSLHKFRRLHRRAEYVGKGAFIVRGQRTWYKDLNVEIGIGIVAINGVPLMMTAAPDEIRAMCPRYAILRPGLTKKERIAKPNLQGYRAIYRRLAWRTARRL